MTSSCRKGEGRTTLLEIINVFLDLFVRNAILENYDEACRPEGPISVVPPSRAKRGGTCLGWPWWWFENCELEWRSSASAAYV